MGCTRLAQLREGSLDELRAQSLDELLQLTRTRTISVRQRY